MVDASRRDGPELPSVDLVATWLRQRLAERPPTQFERLLGVHARTVDLGPLEPIASGFFREHRIFRVSANPRVLPRPLLPRGSWGVLAFGPAGLLLLAPGDGSMSELLRREGRPIDAADPAEFAQFLSDAWLSEGTVRHTVLRGPESLTRAAPAKTATAGLAPRGSPSLASFGGAHADDYVVDADELARVAPDIVPPQIDVLSTETPTYRVSEHPGWRLSFTSVCGFMHDQRDLGVEVLDISSSFEVRRSPRRTLSPKIFSAVPRLRY